MKKLITLSLLFFAFTSNKANAQIDAIDLTDTNTYCSNYMNYITFYVGNQTENNPIFNISWGDGTSEQINGDVYVSGQYGWIPVSHSYTSIGTFDIVVSMTSTVTNQLVVSPTKTLVLTEIGACGYIYGTTYQATNCGTQLNYYHYNAVYDLTDVNGLIQTFQGSLTQVNVNNIPYTINLNQGWLANNSLAQTSPAITITGFDQYGYPIEAPNFTVSSTNVSTSPDFGFAHIWGVGYSAQQKAFVNLYITNYSCTFGGNVRVDLTFPSFLVPITTNLLNPSVVGNVLSFDLVFNPNLYYNYFYAWLEFDLPGTTPAGTLLNFSATIADLDGLETNLINNTADFTGIVWNSYDPNDKLVNKPENINPTEQEELTYTINFQNEGNADALKVVVKDTLSDNLDLSTFEIIRTKHNVVTSVNPTTREVKFTFNDIYLAPKELDEEASKGYIVYKIKEKVNLPINSEIKNTAYIYFDFNPAIITNTTLNRNTLLSVSEIAENDILTIYPNPVKDELQIKSTEEVKSISIYTTNGVKVMENNQTTSIDVSKLVNGVYFVEILSDSTMRKEKIVVQH